MKQSIILLLMLLNLFASDIEKAQETYNKGDYVTAFHIVNSLASNGDAKAQYELGRMYYKGEGTSKNEEKAVYWWEKSGQQGHIEAQINLVHMYLSSKEMSNDNERSMYWLKKAAQQGNAEMQFLLAYIYSSGEDILKDKDKAFYWAKKATEQKHPNAKFILGYMYCHAYGTPKDLNKCAFLTNKFYLDGNEKALKLWDEFNLTPSHATRGNTYINSNR